MQKSHDNIGIQVLNIIKYKRLFKLYNSIQLDSNRILFADILEFFEDIAEEEYEKLFGQLGRDILSSKFCTTSTKQFANYYHNNKYINKIINIQFNYITFNLYTVNYNNKITLFSAITQSTANTPTTIYKLY